MHYHGPAGSLCMSDPTRSYVNSTSQTVLGLNHVHPVAQMSTFSGERRMLSFHRRNFEVGGRRETLSGF